MEIISSKDNKKIKEARKLLTKKYRKNSYLIEGFHLLEEALKAGRSIKQIFVEENKLTKLTEMIGSEKSLTDLSVNLEEVIDFSAAKFLLLENVQDPGNVGTMIRTADAAGFSAVILLGETADIYSPKVMRSMQGSNFHLPLVRMAKEDCFAQLKKAGISILTTTLSANSVSYKIINEPHFALIMGNEGAGVSDEAIKAADKLVHIDMPGQAESLNVAVAAGILMFSL